MKPFALLLKWMSGGAISIGLVWLLTAVFTGNIHIKIWSPSLQRNILSPGSLILEREEGWATSVVGGHGIIGASQADLEAPSKILIWGDSFVEAFHVDDSAKMQKQLDGILHQRGEEGTATLAIGEHFASIADYRFRIPDYEKVLGKPNLHVIHIYSLDDTFPDQYPGGRRSLFLSEPELRLEKYDNEFREIEEPEVPGRARLLIERYRLQFFSRLRTNLMKIAKLEGLRFSLGVYRGMTVAPGAHRAWNRFLEPAWDPAEPPVEAWRFLLTELDEVTEVPLLFVYGPPTPALTKGTLVKENPEGPLVTRFAELCAERGIGFASLEGPFGSFLGETGRMPKGFHNSRPWEGHYNADGHRLVAEAIADWIELNRHAVYPD